MNDSAETGQGTSMAAADAAAIMAEAQGLARRRLQPDHRVAFLATGMSWLIGYGLIWLAVRGQHPYRGINPGAYAAVFLIGTVAALGTVGAARAETGIGGLSALRRRVFFLATFLGYAAVFTLEAALYHAGASRTVIGVFEAAAPVLVTGLLYLARSAATQDWPVAGLGLWLIVVAAASGFAGPRSVWGIDSLAVGLSLLLMAALQVRLHRS